MMRRHDVELQVTGDKRWLLFGRGKDCLRLRVDYSAGTKFCNLHMLHDPALVLISNALVQ